MGSTEEFLPFPEPDNYIPPHEWIIYNELACLEEVMNLRKSGYADLEVLLSCKPWWRGRVHLLRAVTKFGTRYLIMATLSDDTFQAGLSQIYESGNDIAVILLEVSRHMRCERVIECMTDFKARWGTSTLRVSSIASWNSREKFQDERGCWQDTALEAVLQEAKQIWLGKYAHWVKLDLNLEKANPSPPVDISWRQMRR